MFFTDTLVCLYVCYTLDSSTITVDSKSSLDKMAKISVFIGTCHEVLKINLMFSSDVFYTLKIFNYIPLCHRLPAQIELSQDIMNKNKYLTRKSRTLHASVGSIIHQLWKVIQGFIFPALVLQLGLLMLTRTSLPFLNYQHQKLELVPETSEKLLFLCLLPKRTTKN